MDDALDDRLSKLNLEIGEIACYVSCENMTMTKFRHLNLAFCAGLRLDTEAIFYTVGVKRLELLTTRLNRTRVVVLLLTKKVFHAPHVIAEIAKAIELDIPIVPISIERGSFESTKTLLTSPDFPTKLETENPGATKTLERIGIDLKRAHASLSDKVPTLVVKELDPNADVPSWFAAWKEIFKEIARVIKLESRMGGETRERAMRIGHYTTFSDFSVRQVLENLKFKMSPTGSTGGGALNDLRRDVYLERASIENVITMAESVKTDPTKLSACLELIIPSIGNRCYAPLSLTTHNRIVNVINDALATFGQKHAEVAQAGCEAVASACTNCIADDDVRSPLLYSGMAQAIIIVIMAFGEKDPATAKSGYLAVEALIGDGRSTMSTIARAVAWLGGLEAIMMPMRAFGHLDAGVAEAGCRLISLLSRADMDLAVRFVKLGAAQAVVAAMKAFSAEYLAVNESGAIAIVNLCVHSLDVRCELMNLGAGSAVVEALKRAGPRFLGPAVAGCAAVGRLCATIEEVNTELMRLGAGEAVVAAMRAWGTKDVRVPECGCMAIERLAFYGNAVALMKMGAGEVVISTMRVFGEKNTNVAKYGCSGIANLMRDDHDDHVAVLKKMRAHEVVIAAMRAFGSSDARIAEFACDTIAYFISSHDDAIDMMNGRAGEVIIATMRAFGDKVVGVAAMGCHALGSLSYSMSRDQSLLNALMELGAGEVIVKAMNKFGETDAQVASSGCLTIGSLVRNSVGRQVALTKMGAGEAVISVMRSLGSSNEEVASRGCGAISALCENSLGNALELMRAGAGELVVAAMRTFGETSINMAKWGVITIFFLTWSRNDDIARTLLRLGAAEVVLSALNAFGEQDDKLAEHGCAVIARLAIDTESVRVLRRLGAGEVVITMMSKWRETNVPVILSGCWTISSLAVDESAVNALMESGAGEAVVEATRRFAHFDEVAECGCLAIARLSRAREARKVLMNLKADELVVRMLRYFGDWSSEVADRACEAIVNLMMMTSSDPRRFWEFGAGVATMDVLRVFGEIDAGVAENGCRVLVRFAEEEEWRREMKNWEGIKELLERIRMSHQGENARVVREVEEVMRLLG